MSETNSWLIFGEQTRVNSRECRSKGVNKHSIGFLAERVIEKGMEEEQHKRHCLPAPRKLGDKKVEDEEHRVKNRKFCPDRKGVPVGWLDKEIHGINQRHPAHDPTASDELPYRIDDVPAPACR